MNFWSGLIKVVKSEKHDKHNQIKDHLDHILYLHFTWLLKSISFNPKFLN